VIDTHCHLLPGLDDGPKRTEESLDLARALLRDGIDRVLCTPHYSSQFPTSHADAEAALRDLRPEVEALGLSIALAAEVSPGHAVSAPLQELRARAIAGRWLLVEVLRDTPATFFESVFARLEEISLTPVFAHPERCRAIQRSAGLADRILHDGGVLQVVAPSLIGRFGDDAAAAGWRLVDTGRAALLASDSHGTRRRSPHLGDAVGLVAARLGDAAADELTEHGPARLLAGERP
jgi:protein-tyrosine phosphatase